MSEETLVAHCSPVLAGLKTANMFNVECSDTFPHEIGLFLGYPPKDVKGFIEEGPRCAKCTGCWQVYGDEEKALKTFERYRKCTEVYCAQVSCGKSLERLTVKEKAN